nr:M48 family metallopeptidase [Pseudopedobacter sp.]
MKRFHLFLLSVLSLIFTSCGGGFLDFVPLSVDQDLGLQSQAEINSSPQTFKVLDPSLYPKPYKEMYLIRDKILSSGKVAHKDDFAWELKIIEDDSVLNAFCLPGGYIYVYTGLIKYLDTEDALAGVLGHEMAHADLRHSTDQLVKNAGLSFVIQLIFGVDNSTLVNLGANLLSLSFSRSDENDADMQSVEYLYNTDLDARGASRFFQKLQTDQKDPGVIEFISTHPNPEHRVQKIINKWKELGGKTGETYKPEYQKLKKKLP